MATVHEAVQRVKWEEYQHLRIVHGRTTLDLHGLTTLDQLRTYHHDRYPDCEHR